MSNGGLLGSIPDPLKPSKSVLGWSLFLFCAMNIAHIAIGVIYLDECTRQHYIPVYLIVLGVFGLVHSMLFCLYIIKTPDDDTSNTIIRLFTAINSLITFFLFCWFFTGACLNCVFGCLKPLFYIYINEGNNSQYKNNNRTNYSLQNDHKTKTVSTKIEGNMWIFSIYQPNYNKNTTNGDPYCNKTLYLFALWTTIFFYILLGLFLVYLILLVWHTPRNLGNDIVRPTNQ